MRKQSKYERSYGENKVNNCVNKKENKVCVDKKENKGKVLKKFNSLGEQDSISNMQLIDQGQGSSNFDWQNQLIDDSASSKREHRNPYNYQVPHQDYIQCQPLFQPSNKRNQQKSTKTHLRTQTQKLSVSHNLKNKLPIHQKYQLQCTFQPSILKKSTQIAQNLKPSFQRLTECVRHSSSKQPYQEQKEQKRYSQTRITQLSQPRKLKTQTEQVLPSFRPCISKKSIQGFENDLNIIDRNKIWFEQKQAKIQKLRQQEQQTRLKTQSYSHAPKIKHYRGETQVVLSNFVKQGIANYFQRLNVAKKKISLNEVEKRQNKTLSQLNKENQKYNFGSNKTKGIKPSSYKENQRKIKKNNYQKAVNELHQKIMKLKL